MNELSSSIAEAVKLRATTSLLGTYFLFWAAIHWQAFYTTIFVSEEIISNKFNLTKNEYINSYFIQPSFDSEHYWLGVIIPAILTYLWIWVFPDLLFLRAFKRERKYKFEKRSEIINDQIRLKRLEEEIAEKNANIANLELEAAKKELSAARSELSKTKSQLEVERIFKTEEPSENEKLYKDFMRKKNAKQILSDIKECIYEHNGRLSRPIADYTLAIDSLVAADTNKLISRVKGAGYPTIELTDLGKYFLSKQ